MSAPFQDSKIFLPLNFWVLTILLFCASCGESSPKPKVSDTTEVTPRAFESALFISRTGRKQVRLVSQSELEITDGTERVVGQYSRDGKSIRATAELYGTKRSYYYKVIELGLQDEDGLIIYEKSKLLALVEQDPDIKLYKAVEVGDVAKIQAAIAAGAKINGGTEFVRLSALPETPLKYAIESWKAASVKALLEKGADPNLRENGETPLSYTMGQFDLNAGRKKYSIDDLETICNLLLKKGADANAFDTHGESPLKRAQRLENTEAKSRIIKLLADFKAPRK